MKKPAVILLHAFIGWAFCAAIMGIGMSVTTMKTTLIIHLIGGPLGFILLSVIYFKFYHYTTPLMTGLIFTIFIIAMDFFIVAMLIMKNYDMFRSAIGTWIPFTLIFLATFFTGKIMIRGENH